MGSMSDIVAVNVSTLTTAVKQAGFGVPLIADYHTHNTDRVRYYTSLQGLLDDGFTVNDGAYKAASAMLAQTPQVARFAVGRRALAPDLQVDLYPTAINSRVYNVGIIGPTGVAGTATFTSDATATVAEIVAGLVASINALAAGVTATNAITYITIKASAGAGLSFSVNPEDLNLITAQQTHADPGIATDLAAILLANSDWYGLTLSTMGKAEIVAAAAWVEANKRFAIFSTQDGDILASGTSDVASTVKNANEFRSIVSFHKDGNSFSGAAWLGSVLPYDPGSITFKFRKLAGVANVTLTATHLTNLRAKNCGFFTDFGGVSITAEGKTAAGEFADVIRDRDWFESRLQTRTFTVFVNSLKIPFTDGGIAAVEAQVRAQLTEGIASGFLAESPAPVVVVPLASAVASVDKAARNLKTITFQAPIAGAIHAVTLTGTITL